MKLALTKIGLPRAIGLYIDEHEVVVSNVVSTPVRQVEVGHYRADYVAGELGSTIDRLLTPILSRGKRRHIPVSIGLPNARVFFSTRPIQSTGDNPSPDTLLRESLHSNRIETNEMIVDVIQSQPRNRRVASIVACRKDYLDSLLQTLNECGICPFAVEPAACSLLRAGANTRRLSRTAKTILRIFVSRTKGVAVLGTNDLPVIWREFDLRQGDESTALLATARSLQAVSEDCGLDQAFDRVTIHGRADLGRLVQPAWLQGQIGGPVDWINEPPLDSATIAFGLALGALKPSKKQFDLARTLKPKKRLLDVFPLKELGLQASLLAGMGLFLAFRSDELKQESQAFQIQNAQYNWLQPAKTAEVEKEKSELDKKVSAVHKFLDGRVVWSSHLRDISKRLPKNIFLTSFTGTAELKLGRKSKGKSKQSLVLNCAATIPPNGSTPRAIDRFLDELREDEVLKQAFPIIELADLKQFQTSSADDKTLAFFTVVCLPKGSKPK